MDQSNTITTNRVELGDIFRMHRQEYCDSHVLSPQLHKVINAVCNCRTVVLGGHTEQCNHCDHLRISYNSCRNRHCPKCQSLKTVKWLEARQQELLPIPYFHVVFTLPHELNTLVLYNKKILYTLLMQSVWETIKTLGQDPKRLNGAMGAMAILHTWGQNLSVHNHVHCIVPGGAITANNKWRAATSNYLFPVKVMSKIFRGIFIAGLKKLHQDNQFKLPEDAKTGTSLNFTALLDTLMQQAWVVYAKEPFAGPTKLLDYLGRYVNKIAISNCRIISSDATLVKFKWRDYADNNKVKIMEITPAEFIRRFLSHVVPNGFMRVRFFGFLANACKKTKIAIIRQVLAYTLKIAMGLKKDIRALMLELTGNDIMLCPKCRIGHLYLVQTMPNQLAKITANTS